MSRCAVLLTLGSGFLSACDPSVEPHPSQEPASAPAPELDSDAEAPEFAEPAEPAEFEVKHKSFWPALAFSEQEPNAVPPGANRWDCMDSASHPRPVILVHGTWVNQYDSFAKLAPTLSNKGFCVYTFNFGKDGTHLLPLKARYGTSAIENSVLELKAFSKKVREKTGADKVDMVGWSQGGILIRSYLNDHGGANPDDPRENHVERVVTLGAPHRGTTLSGLALLGNLLGITDDSAAIIGQGPVDQAVGSDFLAKLNQGEETAPGVHYTSIFTIYDQIVNPFTSSILKAGKDATVTNISLQEGCPIDFSDHLALTFTPRVTALIIRALDPKADVRVPCQLQIGSLQ